MTYGKVVSAPQQSKSLVEYFADRAGIDPSDYLTALKAFLLPGNIKASREELISVMLVAKRFDLDPFSKEIYAVPGRSGGPIRPVIAYDGWLKILFRQPNFDGYDWKFSDETYTPDLYKSPVPVWCECTIYDKVRSHPITVREYFDEVARPQIRVAKDGRRYLASDSPWVQMPKRMLRTKTVIQAIRNSYAIGGDLDGDTLCEADGEDIEQSFADTGAPALVPAPEPAPAADPKPAPRRAQVRVTPSKYPDLSDKASLDRLLTNLVKSASDPQKQLGLKGLQNWILKNLDAGCQAYAIDFCTKALQPKPAASPAPAPAVPSGNSAEPQTAKAVKPAPVRNEQRAPDPLGDADADCFGLESFSDGDDIDAL